MSPNDHHTPVPRAFSIPPPDSVSDPLAALDGRLSVPAIQLQAPGPDDATLLRLLRSAVRVPDHGKRVPFRYITLRDEARKVFG